MGPGTYNALILTHSVSPNDQKLFSYQSEFSVISCFSITKLPLICSLLGMVIWWNPWWTSGFTWSRESACLSSLCFQCNTQTVWVLGTFPWHSRDQRATPGLEFYVRAEKEVCSSFCLQHLEEHLRHWQAFRHGLNAVDESHSIKNALFINKEPVYLK